MAYMLSFRKRAAKEYLKSVAWYNERSQQAAENFVLNIDTALNEIKNEPGQFRKSYKDFHEVKVRKYPFIIIYFIDYKKNLVIITSVFHQKRNPQSKF